MRTYSTDYSLLPTDTIFISNIQMSLHYLVPVFENLQLGHIMLLWQSQITVTTCVPNIRKFTSHVDAFLKVTISTSPCQRSIVFIFFILKIVISNHLLFYSYQIPHSSLPYFKLLNNSSFKKILFYWNIW